MENVNKKVVLIALILAVFTTFMVFVYVKNATSTPEVKELVNVYIAARTMPAKYKITEADIRSEKIERQYMNARTVMNKEDIIGKRLKERVIEGEQILSDRLVADAKDSLAFHIPEGKRAVSISVNEQINVSNLVRPGDYVDIIASFGAEEVSNASGTGVTAMPQMSLMILQNIEVLALGQDQLITAEKIEPPNTITLAVDVKDVERLVYASEYAILRLVLRPVDDKDIVENPGATRKDLTPGRGITYQSGMEAGNGKN